MTSVIRGSDNMDSAVVESGRARAWVNFNGIGTVAIGDQLNVSSLTDNGVGDYTVNYTSAMSSANYAEAIGGGGHAGNSFVIQNKLVGSLTIRYYNGTPTLTDISDISVSVFANP